MSKTNQKITCFLAAISAAFLTINTAQADEANPMFENLEAVGDPKVAVAYIDPNADFSEFKRVMLLDTAVAFRSGWERDQRRGTRSVSNRISSRDIEQIKTRVSELFNSVFIEVLEADDGYEVVTEADYDVLLIRAAIIDLDITAPDTMSASRSRSFTANSGAATLYIELFDSVSGQIIGRAADRQAARSSGSTMTWTTRVSNTSDARRVFRNWATTLRGFLDSHYSAK